MDANVTSKYTLQSPNSKGGLQIPRLWDQIPYRPGGWVLHQPPWSFGFDSQINQSTFYCSYRNKTYQIWSPPRAGLGPVRNPVLLHRVAPCFPWFLSFGIEPKTPEWLVQDPTASPSGDLIPTIRGSGAHPGRGMGVDCSTYFKF